VNVTNTFTITTTDTLASGVTGWSYAGSHEYEYANGSWIWDGSVKDCSSYPLCGRYRAEIIPTTPALIDTFLNVVEGHVEGQTLNTPAYMSGTTFEGASVGNRAAAFCAQASVTYTSGVEATCSTGTIVLPDVTQTIKILISDLPAATARSFVGGANLASIAKADGTDSNCTAGAGGGCTSSAGTRGTVYLSVAVTAGGNAASRTITIGAP
jgi:hypothetical protein